MLTRVVEHAEYTATASESDPKSIPTTFNQHALLLKCETSGGVALTQAEIEADITSVNVSIKERGGSKIDLIPELSPAVIFDLLNDYPDAGKATYTNSGILRIPWVRPRMNAADFRALSLGMRDVDPKDGLQLRITYASSLAQLATVKVSLEYDEEDARPLGQYIRIEKRPMSAVGSTGEAYHESFVFEPGTSLLGYHIALGSTPGVISYVKARVNGRDYWNKLDIAMRNLLLRNAQRTPNGDYFTVPFDLQGIPLNIGAARSFQVWHNWTTVPGSAYNIYFELMENNQRPNV
jgi:hypothetical protein